MVRWEVIIKVHILIYVRCVDVYIRVALINICGAEAVLSAVKHGALSSDLLREIHRHM